MHCFSLLFDSRLLYSILNRPEEKKWPEWMHWIPPFSFPAFLRAKLTDRTHLGFPTIPYGKKLYRWMEECMPHIFFFLLPMWDMGKWVGRTGEEFCGYSGWEKIMHFFRTFCGKSFFPSSSCRRRCCCCIRFECCIVTPFPFPRIDSINTKREARKKPRSKGGGIFISEGDLQIESEEGE